VVSNTQRKISFFLSERKAALDFIILDKTYETLQDPVQLGRLLDNMKRGFGGFVDLGVIDSSGCQCTYVGPYQLEGKNYSDQSWYKEVKDRGMHISEVFLGFRQVPHLVIAVRHNFPDGGFFVLRATLDTAQFNELLSELELAGRGDAFIINHEGRLQTPSDFHGKVLEKLSLPVPQYAPQTEVFEGKSSAGRSLIIGYRYISDTPFILMAVKEKRELMKAWSETRLKLIGFLSASVIAIMMVIMGGVTFLVNRIFLADQRRVMALHEVEYANKMASIGRLSAGVAHEINNPLAIIDQKAGLIKDLFMLKKEYAADPKLMDLIDSVLRSVDRCAGITRRLLNFARRIDVNIRAVNLEEIIREVLGFLVKEAEYRSIDVKVDVPADIPMIESDQGRLQEIFLNLINNAFAALSDGGQLSIAARKDGTDRIAVSVTDNGHGISEKDLKRIFEPFFSTKTERGGTGLGLSITYGLVQELGGKISVHSQVGKGTSFIVELPLKLEKKEKKTA
jgi:signal transduction histidine kinase